MKLLGSILIMLSTTLIGLGFSNSIKDKIFLCSDIIEFCDSLSNTIKYSKDALPNVIAESKLKKYVPYNYFDAYSQLNFPFSKEENFKINDFFSRLGKDDMNNEISKISSFKSYVEAMQDKYKNIYKSKSKVYITMGMGSGIVMSLMII